MVKRCRFERSTEVGGQPIPHQDDATPHMVSQLRQESDHLPAAHRTG
jgi:hypothetical protein